MGVGVQATKCTHLTTRRAPLRAYTDNVRPAPLICSVQIGVQGQIRFSVADAGPDALLPAVQTLEQSNVDEILTEAGSVTSLNFGQDNQFGGNASLVPPEVKDWLVTTFSSLPEQEKQPRKEKLSGKLSALRT